MIYRGGEIFVKKKKFGVESLEKFLGVPTGVVSNAMHMEMNGNREVEVEGCRNILPYDTTDIKLDVGKMTIAFTGRNLTLKNFSTDSLIIEGFILSINFIC